MWKWINLIIRHDLFQRESNFLLLRDLKVARTSSLSKKAHMFPCLERQRKSEYYSRLLGLDKENHIQIMNLKRSKELQIKAVFDKAGPKSLLAPWDWATCNLK